jgi:acetyl-CoA carboxylase alpha subunit
MAQNLGESLQDALQKLSSTSTADLLKARLDRLLAYGRVKEQALR